MTENKLAFKERSLEEKKKSFEKGFKYKSEDSVAVVFIPHKAVDKEKAKEFKLMVIKTITFAKLQKQIRSIMNLEQDQNLFCYTDNHKLITVSAVVGDIAKKNIDKKDSILYVEYSFMPAHG